MSQSIRLTPITRKALSLERDGVFRLLVVMTALLGWVVALGLGGALVMHHVYGAWKLEREQTLLVYLMPDSDAAAVQQFETDVTRLPGVVKVGMVPPADLQALLAPYVGGGAAPGVPLPQVVEVEVGKGFDRQLFDPVVKARFATAEVDDAQPVLLAVSRGVHVVMAVGVALALVMAAVMALLVTLTVRAGLRAQRGTLELLQQLGATDRLIMRLVAGQVLERVLLGWALAGAAAVAVMVGGAMAWPVVAPYVGWGVWSALAVGPAILPVVAWVTAWGVAQRLLNMKRES